MKPHPLKFEREQRGWSQGRIAEAVGTTIRTVSRWEQGITMPSPYYREQLCTLFGKNAKQLGLVLDINENEIIQEAEALLPLEILPSSLYPLIHGLFLTDPAIPETLDRTGSLLGRSGLLARVKQQLFEGDNLALTALNGLPGIGKTTLAIAVATDEQVQSRFRDGILWVGLGPHPNVQGQLARWGKLLGIAPKDVENVNSRQSWARTLRVVIGTRHFLLVIDDAWTVEDALAFQVGGAHCAHLLTTRLPQVAFAFAQKGTIVVPELEDSDGLALLDRFVPQLVLQDPQGARILVQAVGGLPLALTLMGKYLAAQSFTGQPRRLQTALTQLHNTKHRLHLSIPTALRERSPSLPANIPLSLHAAIAISDQQLSSQAHATLCALSVFSPKPNTFSEEAALAVSQQQVEMLDVLWDAGLLESSGPERYTLHQTIADYARIQLQDTTAQQRLVNYMLQYVQQHEQDYDTLEPEASNILTALDIAITLDMGQELIQVMTALVPFIRIRGRYAQTNRYLQAALKMAITLKDAIGQMTILRHLASIAELQGDYSSAETYGRDGLALARQLGKSDAEIDLLTTLGQVAFRCRNYVQAQAIYEEGLRLTRQLGDDERTCTLLCYLGRMVSQHQDNYIEAETLYQEGLTLARQSGHQELICSLLAYLGWIAVRQGSYAQAERYCLEGLALARQLSHRENLGYLLNNLGTIAWERGNYEQSEAYYQEALALARQTGHRKQICNVLAYLGEVSTFPFQDKYDQAKRYLQEGIDLARQIEGRSVLPFLLMGLGATFGGQGDYNQANIYLQESVELGRRYRSAWEITATLTIWGLVHLKYQQLDAATTVFHEVLTVNSSSKWDRELSAVSTYGLAQVAALRGDVREARRLAEDSLARFEAIEHYWAGKARDLLHSLPEKKDASDETPPVES
jgi:tetratricopeptide (TPR) repeat protein/transcriptional regulator with XRE-family HTH domain